MAVPKKKTSKAKGRSRQAANWRLAPPGAQRLPALPPGQGAPRGLPELRVVQGPPGRRGRLTWPAGASARRRAAGRAARRRRRHGRRPGARRDRGRGAPGGRRARHPRGAGRPARAGRRHRAGSSSSPCTEVIAMDEDPAQAVRRKKDSSLVRAAELVRDGKASAMVSAGNTGATMASALLRMGRLRGVVRPCIATPLPRLGRHPGRPASTPGPTPSARPPCWSSSPRWASAYADRPLRHRRARPSACSPSARSRPRATPLVKETHALLGRGATGVRFVGNVEGRDLLDAPGRRGRDRRVHRATWPSRPWRARCGSCSTPCSRSSAPTRRPRRPPRSCCPTCSRSPRSSTRRTPAGPCSSGSTGCA